MRFMAPPPQQTTPRRFLHPRHIEQRPPDVLQVPRIGYMAAFMRRISVILAR